MNLRDDINQLKMDQATLRKFGLVVGGVFVAFGLFFLWRHPNRTPYFVWPGGMLMVVGAVLPRTLKWVYVAWMSLAIVLGFVVSGLLLTLFFFVVITPIGWVARGFGNDFLSLKLDRPAASYWIPRERKPHKPAEYERQF